MSKPIYFTNEEMLQNAKVLFETIENNSTIAEKLDDYGYPAEEIAKGKALYQTAQTQYGNNQRKPKRNALPTSILSKKWMRFPNSTRSIATRQSWC